MVPRRVRWGGMRAMQVYCLSSPRPVDMRYLRSPSCSPPFAASMLAAPSSAHSRMSDVSATTPSPQNRASTTLGDVEVEVEGWMYEGGLEGGCRSVCGST